MLEMEQAALATYYDTLYVSVLFDMRDSGEFPTFHHSVLSFSVSMIFDRLCLYKRPYGSRFFEVSFLVSCQNLRTLLEGCSDNSESSGE